MIILRQILISILQFEARLVLEKYKPKVVSIAGSVGKTSTKDALYAVLSKFYYVRKSSKGYGNELGLPLAILGCEKSGGNIFVWIRNIWRGIELMLFKEDYPDWLILEISVRKPKSMQKITTWLKSDIVIIGRFGDVPVHIEFFDTLDELILEKSKILRTLNKNGVVILNADDNHTLSLKNKAKNKVVTFGFNKEAVLTASNMQILYDNINGNPPAGGSAGGPVGIMFRVNYSGNSVPITILGALGVGHVYAALASLAVAAEIGLNVIESTQALKNYDLPPGRMRLLDGVKETLIIDDSYNSSPIACENAINTLEEIKISGRKIAVLGDMLELGRHTDEEHKKIGKLVAKVADVLVTVGIRAPNFALGAMNFGMDEKNIYQFEDSREAGKFVEQMIKKGDLVLVKGSQAVRMEKVVEEIMAHPEKSQELLVRQAQNV